jgi:dephospho-CoA kinase
MILVGLTGSIGMGKSTTTRMFAAAGAHAYDADAEVHRLYTEDVAAISKVEAAFPGVTVDGVVDRKRLGERVLGNPEALARLNAIVWPLMGEARAAFLAKAHAEAEVAVLDIPLLFETGGERSVDVTVERVLARAGMTPAKFEAILAVQMPDAEKRARADFIVDTSTGLDAAKARVDEIMDILRERANRAI